MKTALHRLCLTSTIALALTLLLFGSSHSESHAAESKDQRSRTAKLVLPPLRPGPAPGGRRQGGGYRDDCPEVKPDLTALVPDYSTSQKIGDQSITMSNIWGTTSVDRPTFWFYVPYTRATSSATFSVIDEQTKATTDVGVLLPTQPGVVRVTLPETAAPLAIDKSYRWYFKVVCKAQNQARPQKPSAPVYVEGVVTRTRLQQTTITQLQAASPLDQVALYAQEVLWYDALNTVAELLQKNPQNTEAIDEWRTLLSTVGLEDMADKPLAKR